MASSNSVDSIQNDQENELLKAFADCGMSGIVKATKAKLDEWKQIPINIAVIGRTGVGKSTLINAIIGIDQADDKAAETGPVETTLDVTSYQHPEHKQLVFFDLPGVGTPKFPRKTYLTRKDIGFEKYDMFIIVSSERFCEDDKWLGDEIKGKNKRFAFVRTKVDNDLSNEQKAKKTKFSSENVIEQIRKYCGENLGGSNGLFLVDSLEPKNDVLEFQTFIAFIIDTFPANKKDALILAMSTTTSKLIKEKERVMTKRIYGISLVSAVGGAIPLPGLSTCIDVTIILNELMFYQAQYRIFEAFAEIAKLSGLTMSAIPKRLKLSQFAARLSQSTLLPLLPALGLSEFIEDTVSIAVPILGSIIGGVVSYGSTVLMLKRILKNVTDDARKIEVFLADHQWDTESSTKS